MSATDTNSNNLKPEATENANGSRFQPQMTREEEEVARAAARFGYGPLAQVNTAERPLPAFGGEFQPGLYPPVEKRKFANPAPLGLSAFALTTFVLGCINMEARDITVPNIVIGLAFGYGGLVQLLAGMWYVLLPLLLLLLRYGGNFSWSQANWVIREMAVGNTFGATALSSYGGFWIAFAIVLTPGGFQIAESYESSKMFNDALGLFLFVCFFFFFFSWQHTSVSAKLTRLL